MPIQQARDTTEVPIDDKRPKGVVVIGAELPQDQADQLVKFLQDNSDIFAWSASDLPGINREVVEHAL
jgi:hypothetical protein